MTTIHAFVPAAGLGERLRPITDHIPKPLLPILGRPILDIVLDRVIRPPVDMIGINLHHKADLIRKWVERNHPTGPIMFFHEDTILGTGGALKNAQSLLRQKHFLVHNADIISNIDLGTLVERHLHSKNIATLAVHDYEPFNTVVIDRKGHVESVGSAGIALKEGSRRIAFTGIAVYAPEFLDFLPQGRSHVVDAWMKALRSGRQVGTVDVSGSFWSDVGTPDAYSSAVFRGLQEDGESLYVHPSVSCGTIEICGTVVIEENSRLNGPVILKNCIILPDTEVRGPVTLEDTIVGTAYQVPVEHDRKPLEFPLDISAISHLPGLSPQDLSLQPIGAGGSDRKYFRLRYNQGSAILLVCPADDPDYERQMTYTRFFRKYALPVPDILAQAPDLPATVTTADICTDRLMAVFEDLGDMSLYSWLKCNRDAYRIKMMYERVLDILAAMHTTIAGKSHECALLQERIFDFAHLRWETSYFLERFVRGLRDIHPPGHQGLDEEFRRLALRVDGFRKTVIHRDFQSQNIMVTKGDVPRIIDYQGARIGPPSYDLVSLLWDPYYSLEGDMREELIRYYITAIKTRAEEDLFEDEFRKTVLPCRLQRHMQALGAYAYLASVKGKRYFLKYVPPALRYLKEETELAKDEYPHLFHLVHELL